MSHGRELPMLLRAAYFSMHRVSDAHFASHGVTADQFVILACLAEEDRITQKDLAHRASSDPSTIRAMLILLEGRGLIARNRNPDDSRERLVTLTSKGRRLFERLFKSSEPIRVHLLAGFSEDEAGLLVDCLRRLIENMSSARARRGRRGGRSASARAAGGGIKVH
jgi:DNA-binding MarR family transcriptional regulator